MEDNNKNSSNVGLTHFFKWKINSIFFKLKTTSNIFKCKTSFIFSPMEDDIIFSASVSYLASPSLTWAWHSSAPACFHFFLVFMLQHEASRPSLFCLCVCLSEGLTKKSSVIGWHGCNGVIFVVLPLVRIYSGRASGPVLQYRCKLPLHSTKTDPSKVCALVNTSCRSIWTNLSWACCYGS